MKKNFQKIVRHIGFCSILLETKNALLILSNNKKLLLE